MTHRAADPARLPRHGRRLRRTRQGNGRRCVFIRLDLREWQYAILLRPTSSRGLGWALMQLIIEYARSEGLKMICGDVLQENTVMLEMCRNLGFEIRTDAVDHSLCEVSLKL